jgi:hypothetical protein
MSPPPTRLNRRNADDAAGDVCRHASEYGRTGKARVGSHGENAARPWHRHRLAVSKGKDCDRQPRRYVLRPNYERGKARWNAKGVDPDVHRAGGVLVVVRGRESLPHGEGEQFYLLGVQIT